MLIFLIALAGIAIFSIGYNTLLKGISIVKRHRTDKKPLTAHEKGHVANLFLIPFGILVFLITMLIYR